MIENIQKTQKVQESDKEPRSIHGMMIAFLEALGKATNLADQMDLKIKNDEREEIQQRRQSKTLSVSRHQTEKTCVAAAGFAVKVKESISPLDPVVTHVDRCYDIGAQSHRDSEDFEIQEKSKSVNEADQQSHGRKQTFDSVVQSSSRATERYNNAQDQMNRGW